MSEEPIRCTGCGRSFGSHVAAPRARCIYCGARLAGPGCEHLELVDPADPTEDALVPPKPIEPIAVPSGRGPSRWDAPISWLHELSVLAMLLMILSATLGLAHRHDPLLPPRSMALGVFALLPLLWVGGACLRTGLDLLSSAVRSVVLAIPLLAVGLALGVPSALARGLARLERRVFGVYGLAITLAAFMAILHQLDQHHDPTLGLRAFLDAYPTDGRLDTRWEPTPTGWSGTLDSDGQGAFSFRIDEVSETSFAGTLTWIKSGRVDTIRGAWHHNHLAVPYPGPPGVDAWWLRADMLSTMDLWVIAGKEIEGRDLVFGRSLRAKRIWERQPEILTLAAPAGTTPTVEETGAPTIEPPVVLRPMIPVENGRIVQGRAWALSPSLSAEPVLVTAAGLFGPAGGLEHAINPQMLPALVGEAVFFDLLDGSMRARGQMVRPPRGARALVTPAEGLPDASGDVVTLALQPGHSLTPLLLSESPVQESQELWLPTRPTQGREELLRLARVTRVWEQGCTVRLPDDVVLAPQLGAPLLDSGGRVAAMLVGTSGVDGDRAVGIAIPASWIRTRLAP